MKKFILMIITIILCMTCLTCCGIAEKDRTYHIKEQPHLYWKDIDVVVTDIDKKHWFATTHWYEVDITVESKEYGLIKNFEIKGSGAYGCPKEWNYEEGQTVKAQLYSWVMNSTGEIIRREINKIY